MGKGKTHVFIFFSNFRKKKTQRLSVPLLRIGEKGVREESQIVVTRREEEGERGEGKAIRIGCRLAAFLSATGKRKELFAPCPFSMRRERGGKRRRREKAGAQGLGAMRCNRRKRREE